mgnify:CR=1 FL=1
MIPSLQLTESITKLRADLTSAVTSRFNERREQLSREEQKAISEIGRMSESLVAKTREVFGGARPIQAKGNGKAKVKAKSAPKVPANTNAPAKVAGKTYRDPSDPKRVWTGHGPQPSWLKALTGGDKARLVEFLRT